MRRVLERLSGRVSARVSFNVLSDLKGLGAELNFSEEYVNHCDEWCPVCEISDLC